jgi:hypothetical protein
MSHRQTFQCRVAREPWEFSAIHQLNYRTFVKEIPQHPPNGECRLVDRFHEENTYGVCVKERQLLGMVAWRAKRPFSLDYKLDDLDQYLPSGSRPCEIRLLAVEPEHRRGPVFHGLMKLVVAHFMEAGHDLALITGVLTQQKLYRHLGFKPFGPVLGTGAATFQPMLLAVEDFVGAQEDWRE